MEYNLGCVRADRAGRKYGRNCGSEVMLLCTGTSIEEVGRGTSDHNDSGGRVVNPIALDVLEDMGRMSRHPRAEDDNLGGPGWSFWDGRVVRDDLLWSGEVYCPDSWSCTEGVGVLGWLR